MIGSFAPYLTLIVAWILQVMCFQHLVFANGWLLPTFHLYGLLLLPLTWSPLTILMICGVSGALLDLATLGCGVFTSSALIFGLCIPGVNRLLMPREGYEASELGTLKSHGFQWFSTRAMLLLFAHNIWMFTLEAGRWGLMVDGWGKATTSSLFTCGIFLMASYITQTKRRKR
tara:strand:- start:2838 stop:3356 length:519 start_codon:yes stop_codon:yes gene_type:complete